HGACTGRRFTKRHARALRMHACGLDRSDAAPNQRRIDPRALRASLSAEKARAMMSSSHQAPSTTRPRRGVPVKRYALTHHSTPVLSRGLDAMASQDRVTTSGLLAYLAEFDARKLYRPAACSSMFAYCASRLGLSEDSA